MDWNEALRTIAELTPKIEESDGWKIHRRLERLRLSVRTLRENHAELKVFLDPFADASIGAQMFKLPRPMFQRYSDELYRRFHNYLASVSSLIDHSRRIIAGPYEGHEFLDEYNARVQSDFAANPRAQFLKDLRNYVLHFEAAPITFTLNAEYGDSPKLETKARLSLERLLAWDKWSATARRFLSDAPKTGVDLHEVVALYQGDVDKFYDWVDTRVREHHAKELAELREMRLRLTEAEKTRLAIIDAKQAKRAAEKSEAAAATATPEP